MNSDRDDVGPVRDEIAAALQALDEMCAPSRSSAARGAEAPASAPGAETAASERFRELGALAERLFPWIEALQAQDPFVARFAWVFSGLEDTIKMVRTRRAAALTSDGQAQLDEVDRRIGEFKTDHDIERADAMQTARRTVDVARTAAEFLETADRALAAARGSRGSRPPEAPLPSLHSLREIASDLDGLRQRWRSEGRAATENILLRLGQHPALGDVLSLAPWSADLPAEAKRAHARYPSEIAAAHANIAGIVQSAEELIEGGRALESARDYLALLRFLQPHEGHPEMVAEVDALRRAAAQGVRRRILPARILRAAGIGLLVVTVIGAGVWLGAVVRDQLVARLAYLSARDLARSDRVLEAYRAGLPVLGLAPPSRYEGRLVDEIHAGASRRVDALWQEAGPLRAARWARTYTHAVALDPRRFEILDQVQFAVVDAVAKTLIEAPDRAAGLIETAFFDDVGSALEREARNRTEDRAIAEVERLLAAGDLRGAIRFIDRVVVAFPGDTGIAALDQARAWAAERLAGAVSSGDLDGARLMADVLARPEGGSRRRNLHLDAAARLVERETDRLAEIEGLGAAARFTRDLEALAPDAISSHAQTHLARATFASVRDSVFADNAGLPDNRELATVVDILDLSPERIRAELHQPLREGIQAALAASDFERACALFARAAPLLPTEADREPFAADLRAWAAAYPGRAMETLARHPGNPVFYAAAEAALGGRLALWLIGQPVESVVELPAEPDWIGFGSGDRMLAVSVDDQVLVCATDRSGIRYVLETGESLARATLGEFLVVASPSEWVLYRLSDGEKLHTLDVDLSLPGRLRQLQIYDTAVSHRGRFLVTSYSDLDGLVRVYDPVLRKEIVVMQDYDQPGTPVFSPDGGKLAIPRNEAVTVALLGGWKDRLTVPLPGRPSDVCFDPWGNRLAVALEDSIEVYHVGNPFVPGENTASRLLFRAGLDELGGDGSSASIAQAMFDPSGRVLAVVRDDGGLAVWDTSGWRLLRRYTPSIVPVANTAVAVEDAAIAYASGSRLVIVRWRLPDVSRTP